MKAHVVKRRAVKSFSFEKKVGLTRKSNVQRKKPNAEEHKKIDEKVKWKETQRKNGLKWRWRETKKDKENDPLRDKEWSLV